MNIRIILKIVVIIVLIVMTSVSPAIAETWTSKADMPTSRLCFSTSVVNGKIYAIGGGYSIEGPHTGIVEEYNPVTDTWTRKVDMPTGRIGHAASVVNGKIYVFGGDVRAEVSCSTVEEYDPATDTWAARAAMPIKRTFLCSCAVDGKIYVFGGATAGIPEATWNLPEMNVYDPTTDTWTRKADMPTARSMAAATVVNGKIYVIGGVIGNVAGAGVSIVEEYDPVTDIWTRKTNMSTSRKALSASAVAGKIYASGGGTGYSEPFSTLEEYDPATDTWTRKNNMPIARYCHSTSAVDGKIYVFGGAVQFPPHTSTSVVEEYDTGLTASQPDFNGDGLVDIKDLLRLIESWDQDDPTVDIAPPFGDGVIGILDLELLLSYWGQPVDDPTLIAHWALDEVEGDTAYDSIGINNAFVIGNPTWLPDDGQVQGALQLDGIDDCIIAATVLNPANGPFSVFAWVKGNVPGQVIISGPMNANWLCTDPLTGNLMTELKALGRSGSPMVSQTNITDGNWHRIGFVWDGSNRTLYVDGVAVAEDTQANLVESDDGLYIGTGKAMELGTFWFGLIDDVRIYKRAVIP